MTTTRKLIRADGTEGCLGGPIAIDDVKQLVSADGLEAIELLHLGRPLQIMLINDEGHDRQLPINEKASELWWANCPPSWILPIRGDVVIVPRDDYAGDLNELLQGEQA